MEPGDGAAIIDARSRSIGRADDDIEITLEANPNSVEADAFRGSRAPRASIASRSACRSFDDAGLAFLGRLHSVDEGEAALDIAQKHFPRVSFDLIYALPGADRGRLVGDARPGAGLRH